MTELLCWGSRPLDVSYSICCRHSWKCLFLKKACVIPALGTTTRRFLSLCGFLKTTHFMWPFGVEAIGRLMDLGLFISSLELESHLASGLWVPHCTMEYLELWSVIGERSKTSRTDNIFFRDISSYSLHGCTYKCWGFNRSPRLMSTTTSSMTSTAVVCFRHKQTDSFWNK